MAKGFFHPVVGYWQAITEPDEATIAVYPEGFQIVPLKPGADFEWNGAEWVEVEKPLGDPVLTPVQFEWLLAFTGLDEVWQTLEAALKDQDRAEYASLRAQRLQARFFLSVTLEMVAKLRQIAAQVAPGVDLSEAAIRAAWELAEGAEI